MAYVNTSQNNKLFEILNNHQFFVNGKFWRCATVERQGHNEYFKFIFESFNYGSVRFGISEERLVQANDMLGVIEAELTDAVNYFERQQKWSGEALKAYAEQDVIKTAEIYKEGSGGPMAYVKVDNLGKITPVGRNVGISMETTTGVAMTSSNKLTINTISNSNQGENKMDVKKVTSVKMQQVPKVTVDTCPGEALLHYAMGPLSRDYYTRDYYMSPTGVITTVPTTNKENKMDVKMLAYVAANMGKVTELIDKWGTEEAWNINSIIMLDYTYVKNAVIKKNKVVDAYDEEVKVYTATVFKAKNGKWYSSLQNNKLHGVEFGDVINFFENEVLVVKAASFASDDGTVFISKGKAV